jgi:hypothetical protein
MTAQFFIKILVGFLPVLCFLGSLVYLDSYKLVRPRWIVYAIAAGGLAAVPSYFVNVTILAQVDVEATAFSRYIAPVVEEVLKGATLLFLIRTKRVGFLVDTAIFGFAIVARHYLDRSRLWHRDHARGNDDHLRHHLEDGDRAAQLGIARLLRARHVGRDRSALGLQPLLCLADALGGGGGGPVAADRSRRIPAERDVAREMARRGA